MDQIRIGRFIAQCRKAGGLTQRQLADELGISDKTVSKWEEENPDKIQHLLPRTIAEAEGESWLAFLAFHLKCISGMARTLPAARPKTPAGAEDKPSRTDEKSRLQKQEPEAVWFNPAAFAFQGADL